MPTDQARKRPAADMQCSPVLSDGHKSHLSLLTQKVCAKWFEAYWQRGANGAPARWSKGVEKCWKLGVAAAIAATQKELRTVCGQAATDEQLLTYMREKAVREHGQVVNGHKFKRPPSAAILTHYAALGEVWQERYGPHYRAGTVPDDIKELLNTPTGAHASVPSPSRSTPPPCLEDHTEALLQKRPRTQSTNSQGDMTSPKGAVSIGGEALPAWAAAPDTDAENSSAHDTYLQGSEGAFFGDEAGTPPARPGAGCRAAHDAYLQGGGAFFDEAGTPRARPGAYRAAQPWPFASPPHRPAANLDLALHAALADDPPSEALGAPEEAACHGCLDSMSRACSARPSPALVATPGAVQAYAGHRLLMQRLGQLEADLMEAIQHHRANSAELVRRISHLERHMDPGRTKLEESCFDFFNASPIFGDLYRE